jgi:hypothetical protein
MNRRSILAFAFTFLGFYAAISQIPNVTETVIFSEKSAQEILDKYHSLKGAVLNMSREEWAVVRDWEGYDEHAVRVILNQEKENWKKDNESLILERKNMRQNQPGGCDCWIEPDDTYELITTFDWQYTAGAGANVDCSIGPLDLSWTFDFYGTAYNSIYINSKGSISFGNYLIDWTPEEFPNTINEIAQVAGFWADSDYRSSGDIYYKIDQDAVYINFVDVGYYNNHDDLINSYQIIITPTDGVILPDGSNTQMCYLDMNWAHGDVGGSGGCCGDGPATVGLDDAPSTGDHLQYGRFNLLTDDYNGPYGAAPEDQDGVNWLDYKVFNMDAAVTSGNTPPLPSNNLGCDTVYLCQGNEFPVDLSFLAPEIDQNITMNVTDAPGWTYTTEDGSTGNVTGIFVGSATNLGIHEITISATDDGVPASTTEVNFVVEVLDVIIPELTLSGNMSICAGGTAEVTATGDFDNIIWSNGNEGLTNTYNYGGNFFVTGQVGQCELVEYFFIDQSPYFLPDIDAVPAAVCPGQSTIVTVDPSEQPDYDVYQWDADWNGLGGEVLTENGPEAELTAGTYRILITNNEGCQGQRVFNIETIGSYIPEVTVDAFCDGIPEEVVFDGGYSSPDEGALLIYMSSNEESGWGGSFLELIINGESVGILTSPDEFTQHTYSIVAADEIEIIFFEDTGIDSDVLSVSVYNCGFLNQTVISDLTPGTIFSGTSECNSEPAIGTWDCLSGPLPWSFSTSSEYNSVFYPSDYGLYEICFNEEVCETDYCYEIEITEAPDVILFTLQDLLCDGDETTVFAEITDIGGTADINWSAPGTDDVTENTFSFSNTTTYNASVTITNGCGSSQVSLPLYSQYTPSPSLDDESLCDGGTVYLDPTSPDTPDLEFEWFIDGELIPGEIAEEYTADVTGEFCVEVSNLCGQAEACADISIVGDIPLPLEENTVDCFGGPTAVVVPDLPEGYTVVWPDGSTDATWTVDNDGVYDGETFCLDYTDPFGCETNTVCSYLFVGIPPTIAAEPILEEPFLTMCPEVEYDFDLSAVGAGEYEWWFDCNGELVYFADPTDDLTIVSSMLPDTCWGYGITLTGSAINPCAVGGIRQEWEVLIDGCDLEFPNVFTPDYGDDLNESFQVPGLGVYEGVIFRVYNRWGELEFSSDDYTNEDAWRPNNGETGTFWYTCILPSGKNYSGYVTVLRD